MAAYQNLVKRVVSECERLPLALKAIGASLLDLTEMFWLSVKAGLFQGQSIVWPIAGDYSHCVFLIRLPAYCSMPTFRHIIDVPVIRRRLRKSTTEVRKVVEVSDDEKLVILNSAGQSVNKS